MSATINFRIVEMLDTGIWAAPQLSYGVERDAVQAVIAGQMNRPRAAINTDTGDVIYALDATWKQTAAAAALFKGVDLPPLQPGLDVLRYR